MNNSHFFYYFKPSNRLKHGSQSPNVKMFLTPADLTPQCFRYDAALFKFKQRIFVSHRVRLHHRISGTASGAPPIATDNLVDYQYKMPRPISTCNANAFTDVDSPMTDGNILLKPLNW